GVLRWLRREYYDAHGKPPGAQAIQDALATLDAIAHFEGPTYPVYVRVAEHNDAIYVDLCDDAWRAVEITADGWRVVANPPVRFYRTKGMLPLPVPVAGGSVDELRPLLPGLDDEGWILFVSYLVQALRPREERDLLIAARNGWVIALDNLSGTPVWLSDALCRLATGGGWSTRELYSDTDEVLINVQRPVILNGIDDLLSRDDLRDRAIIL